MAENGPREEIAKIVSKDLLSYFKWEQHGPYDQDFPCRKEKQHKGKESKTQSHTHPVDVVFGYKDPYSGKHVYLNTDLKSYGAGSINPKMIQGALTSLAKTIDCAENSQYWQEKYNLAYGDFETRGLLFVYNHDNKHHKEFFEYFSFQKRNQGQSGRPMKPVQLSEIPVPAGKQVHIIDPMLINYLMTITADLDHMSSLKNFPLDAYGFYYPQLTYHKVTSSEKYKPATIEMLTAPFMIIKHDEVINYDRVAKEEVKTYDAGYIVYYNRDGSSDNEFLYLLDLLSKYQILDLNNKIRIRMPQCDANKSAQSHFKRALEKYSHEWGFDESKKEKLFQVELAMIPHKKEFYCAENIGWGAGYV